MTSGDSDSRYLAQVAGGVAGEWWSPIQTPGLIRSVANSTSWRTGCPGMGPYVEFGR